jgi:hypothetical protein
MYAAMIARHTMKKKRYKAATMNAILDHLCEAIEKRRDTTEVQN